MQNIRRAVLAACALSVALSTGTVPRAGLAAETLRYTVTVAPTGDSAIDGAVTGAATLVSLRGDGTIDPVALVARARADETRFGDALQSLGHYRGATAITIGGKPLDDPTLADTLDAAPTGEEVPVVVTITPGPLFHLRHVVLQGDAADTPIDLKPGDPAVAASVLAAGIKLQDSLRASGHAFAHVDLPIADMDPAAEALDVTFPVSAGPRVDVGRIDITGQTDLDEAYIRRRLTLKSGTQYSRAALESARSDLAKVPALASVRLNPGDHVDPDGTVPVTVQVAERKKRAVSVGAAFSTDQGGNVTVGWTHRNLFGEAEVLALSAGVTQIGASAAKQPGYNLGGTLTLPDWRARDQSLSFSALAVRESLDAYDRTAAILGTAFGWRLRDELTASAGLTFEQAEFTQAGIKRHYSLIQTPLALRLDTGTDPIEPTHGLRAELLLTPSQSIGKQSANFLIAQLSASAYFDLARPGRTVLAMRGLAGTVSGASTFDIPPDQRFYAGGGGTVRGYRYQSIGPRLGNNQPAGGSAIAVATLELRQRFGDSYGVAAFLDGGQVGTGSTPFTGKFLAGAGVGARYYTSIGPIRVDVAVPLAKQHGGDALELYIGLGQAF